jgi:uncharacterized membrane protein
VPFNASPASAPTNGSVALRSHFDRGLRLLLTGRPGFTDCQCRMPRPRSPDHQQKAGRGQRHQDDIERRHPATRHSLAVPTRKLPCQADSPISSAVKAWSVPPGSRSPLAMGAASPLHDGESVCTTQLWSKAALDSEATTPARDVHCGMRPVAALSLHRPSHANANVLFIHQQRFRHRDQRAKAGAYPVMAHTAPRTNETNEPTAVADENVRAVARLQQKAAERRSVGQRLSDAIAAFAARESILAVHAFWFALWFLINTGRLPIPAFDPFPFNLLTTIVSLEAIFLALLVLGSQNRMTRDADRRAHLDLQVNLLAEQEMTLVLQMLKEICEQQGLRKTIGSERFAELLKRTDVGELAERVEHTLGLSGGGPQPVNAPGASPDGHREI